MTSEERRKLSEYRLDHDLDYATLAGKLHVSVATAHRLITQPGWRPNERTVNKVRRFLAGLQPVVPTR